MKAPTQKTATVEPVEREITFAQAINEALAEEMRRDPRVFVIGEDVAEAGTPFKVLSGLVTEFGVQRVIDSPISEAGITGIGVGAAEWLAAREPMLVGADNISVELNPNPDPKVSLPVHQIMLVVNGIHLLENLKLDELVAKRVYEFAFIMQPLKIQGGTGSTVAPIAVR